MVVKTKADLEGKYALRSDTEVFELFMDKCEEFGIVWVGKGELPRSINYGEAVDVLRGELGQTDEGCFIECGRTKLTLADFKEPVKTRIEYIKTNKEIFDLKEEFDSGLLYTRTSIDKFNKIPHTQSLAQCVHGGNVYVKTEVEIPWFERLDDFSYPLALYKEDKNGNVEFASCFKDEIDPVWDCYKRFRPATKAEIQVLMDNAPE